MEIRTSVRRLVEFILRSGDIDNRRTAKASADAMQEGGRIHRMIQRRMGPDYHAEVPLRYIVMAPEYDIVIDGRADGVIIERLNEVKADESLISGLLELTEEGLTPDIVKTPQYTEFVDVTIDEIKGTYRDIKRMKDAEGVHLAQAKCYAYILADKKNLKSIRVRITYCHMETEEIRYFNFDYGFDELKEWFDGLISEYRKWADFEFEWRKKRQESIKVLEFPFEYRKGQKELVTHVYNTIYHQRKLFIEAPTGTGKTIATVFPAVKAMGEEITDKIFYLTAKTITRQAAVHALSILRDDEDTSKERKLYFKSVVLTAKDKICFLDESDCNPVSCPYAKGHYDRVNSALYDILTNVDNLDRETILNYSVKYQVCPFELSLDISLFADMVICDYNYLFDPHAYLRRFFTDGVKENHVFLIDEAHNLVERGRRMYSAELVKEELLRVKKLTKEHDIKITYAIEGCNKELLILKREIADREYTVLSEENVAPLIRKVLRLYSMIEDYLDDHEDSPIRKELLGFYFVLSHFLMINDNLGDDYVIYAEITEDNTFALKLFNVDPARNLRTCMERGRASILFSATLLPIDYYKKLLGASEGDYEVYADSVFDPEKRGLYIANDVTSRYTRRGYGEYLKIARYINMVVSSKRGNYMVFFPSFKFMREVADIYIEEYGDEGLLIQSSSMKEKEREEFLSRFAGDFSTTGMCVLGGIFSEGIDLKADSLIGVVIVGTGIPMVCSEREILKKYFDKEGLNGYDYAYKYPGMNKVLQAAGRVIRTSEDIGVVTLLDERFMERGYLRLFPREWGNYRAVSSDNIKNAIDIFWNEWL